MAQQTSDSKLKDWLSWAKKLSFPFVALFAFLGLLAVLVVIIDHRVGIIRSKCAGKFSETIAILKKLLNF